MVVEVLVAVVVVVVLSRAKAENNASSLQDVALDRESWDLRRGQEVGEGRRRGRGRELVYICEICARCWVCKPGTNDAEAAALAGPTLPLQPNSVVREDIWPCGPGPELRGRVCGVGQSRLVTGLDAVCGRGDACETACVPQRGAAAWHRNSSSRRPPGGTLIGRPQTPGASFPNSRRISILRRSPQGGIRPLLEASSSPDGMSHAGVGWTAWQR